MEMLDSKYHLYCRHPCPRMAHEAIFVLPLPLPVPAYTHPLGPAIR